jgi:hypothetical protein
MTQKQIEQYQIRYNLDSYQCQKCGNRATQIAHRCAKTKTNYKVYGKDVIDHNMNLASVCGLSCNSSFNCANRPLKAERLVNLIIERGTERLTSDEINCIINE